MSRLWYFNLAERPNFIFILWLIFKNFFVFFFKVYSKVNLWQSEVYVIIGSIPIFATVFLFEYPFIMLKKNLKTNENLFPTA